jgi:hypothetical protein
MKFFKSLSEVQSFATPEQFEDVIASIKKTSECEYPLFYISVGFKNDFEISCSWDNYNMPFSSRPTKYYSFERFLGKEYKDQFTIKKKITNFNQIPKNIRNLDNVSIQRFKEDYELDLTIFKKPGDIWKISHLEVKLR